MASYLRGRPNPFFMKRLFLIPLLLAALAVGAQRTPDQWRDSARAYEQQLNRLTQEVLDSLRQSESFRTLSENLNRAKTKSDGYDAFVLFTDLLSANYGSFNTRIGANGFPAFNGPLWRIGFGSSTKSRRVITDFWFLAGGLPKRVKQGDEKITSYVSGFLHLDIGYDLLASPRINLYPYAGLSLRGGNLEYERPAQLNPSFTDISDLVVNDPSVFASYLRAAGQAGIGIDLVLSRPDKPGGLIFFAKAGTQRVLGKERFKIEGIKYDPGIRYGDWMVTTGFKIFSR